MRLVREDWRDALSNKSLYGTIPLRMRILEISILQDIAPMPAEETKNNMTGTPKADLATWIPIIIPALKSRWPNHISGLPTNQSAPKLKDWLDLLHVAATTPWKIPRQLSRLLSTPQSGVELQNGWVKLTNLLALTCEAAQAEANQLDPTAWQSLIEIQDRILKHAAHFSLAKEEWPDTAVLTHRALYLQTITDLDKKTANIWDPNELLDEVVTLIQKNLGYEYINLFFLSQSEQTLTLQSAIWKNQRPKPANRINLKTSTRSIVTRVVATGQAILVNDVVHDTNFLPHPDLPNIKAQLAVPLTANNNLIGVLDIESDHLNAFTIDDLEIVQALASYVARTVERARLQAALQRHFREKKLLYESNVALGTSLDMNTVLRLMTQKIAEALGAGACVICQIEEDTNTITALAEYVFRYPGNPGRTWRKLNTPVHLSKDPIGHQALKTNRPVIGRAGVKQSAHEVVWSFSPSPDQTEVGRKHGWGVVLALPLEAENRIIGLVEVYDKNPNRNFPPDDIQLGRILATQTTLAMERARLFDETRQRLNEVSTLYTLAQEISGKLDLQVVLDTIVVSLRQVIGCRGCCIFLLDQNGQQLEIKAADGLKPHWREIAKLRLGEGAAGLAAAEGRTIYIPDTHKDPSFIFFDEEVRSLIVIPLFAQGEIIGTINLDDSRPDAFGPTQERLLAIAAVQAGMVIENARLFAKVSAERQQTQAIIQHMADGLLLINSQGVIITCNQTLATMLGMHPGQIIGQNINSPNLLPPNLASITATTTHLARTGVLAKEVTINAPRPRVLQIFSTPVIGDDKNLIGEVRVVHDITKERELDQLKDDFFSTISHELRTPLFSIQGFAQILLEEEDLDPATRTEFLSTIQRQATQLGAMVNNLLDLAKFDEGKLELEKEPLAIPDLIHQTTLQLQGFAHQRQVKLRSKLPATLPTILGDKQRLEQVLTNLIGNAIKFTETDDEVIVSVSRMDKEIQIAVKDNGIGIPPEDLDQIFSRYYQVENKNERSAMGSGLGLHIAQKIVEGHGGRIWAESTAGQGSTFYFTLPLPQAPLNNEISR